MIEIQNSESIDKPQTAQLSVRSSLDALVEIIAWFAQLSRPPIPQPVWLRCQLALAEGFTNAVRHAHKHLSSDLLIDIEVTVSAQQIVISIWDQGPKFDLMQKLNQLPSQPDKTAGGGRGLKLMQDIADELSYQPTPDQRNCLKIVKNWQATPN